MTETADKLAIIDKIHLYTHAIDRRRWEIMDHLFTEDGEFKFGSIQGPWRGFIEQDVYKRQQLSYPALWALNAGDVIGRHPRGAHPSLVPSQSVTTKGGWGFIMCQTDKFWLALCECIDRPELSQDERFETMAKRRENRDALTPILDQAFQERTASEWVPILAGKVPYAPVHDLKTALENPFVHDIGMIDEVDHPHTETGKLSMLASPIKINGKRPTGRRAPNLGEHNEDVLKA